MKKLKFLIADDEEMIQDLYEMILESEFSCETIKVSNGVDAIAALKESNDFDIIISDYNMPKSKGGDIYIYNKAHQRLPFFLFSGGDLADYHEFKDFKTDSDLNYYFVKPFDDSSLINAVKRVMEKIKTESSPVINSDKNTFMPVRLSYYALHTDKSAEVFIKLSDEKYAKIINHNPENLPESDLLGHYLDKGITHIYLKRDYFDIFLKDVFNKFQQQVFSKKRAESDVEIAGFKFSVSTEGLSEVGIDQILIENVNVVIEETIHSLLNNSHTKEQFKKLCDSDGMIIGHSILIMYVAGRICKETGLNFSTTMKKICGAAFYHDLSLFNLDTQLDHVKITDIISPHDKKIIFDHPGMSADFLPDNYEVVEDTKRIILEHHELPNGEGYPRKLNSNQISPLSCLFILSQEITYCLLRNNFSNERLRDFLKNSSKDYSQGNFLKFYSVAETLF